MRPTITTKFGSRTTTDEILKNIDLTDKRVIVRGYNSGIGFEAAQSLAAGAGAKVVFACRNLAKAQAAADQTGQKDPNAKVHGLGIELAAARVFMLLLNPLSSAWDGTVWIFSSPKPVWWLKAIRKPKEDWRSPSAYATLGILCSQSCCCPSCRLRTSPAW